MGKILVTGGLGYIGSHTVVELVQSGHEVLIVDDLSNSKLEVKSRINEILETEVECEILDIKRTEMLASLVARHDVEAVIHFAAFKAVGESVEHPNRYYRNNIAGLISVLEVMEDQGINKLIFSSSCTVYGETNDLPVTESHPIQKAKSPYGTTKILCEAIIDDFALHKDLKGVHLRYFNPVGAHPSARIGELPLDVPNNLVPYITQTAAGIREKLTVFGDDYNTNDGTCIRDYIHVVDLARAHVKALVYSKKMDKGTAVFNIGTGEGNSVLEVIKSFEKVSGRELAYAIGPRRPGDVEQIWADTSHAETELGWKADFKLDDMMRDAWAWQQNLNM